MNERLGEQLCRLTRAIMPKNEAKPFKKRGLRFEAN